MYHNCYEDQTQFVMFGKNIIIVKNVKHIKEWLVILPILAKMPNQWWTTIGSIDNIGKNAKLDFSSLAHLPILVKKPNITWQWLAIFPILVNMPTVIFTIGKFTNIGKFAKLLNGNNWQYWQYWSKWQIWFFIIGIFTNIGKKAKHYMTKVGNVANIGKYSKH